MKILQPWIRAAWRDVKRMKKIWVAVFVQGGSGVDFCKIFNPHFNWVGKGGVKVVSRSFGRLRRILRIWGLRVFGL